MNKYGKLARGNEELLQAAIDKHLEQKKQARNIIWRARLAARLNKVRIVSETHFYSNGGMIAKAGGLEL